MTSLGAIQADLLAFREARNWRGYHTAESLARAVAVEAGELNELFLWGRHPAPSQVAEEVADVLIYCLNLCNTMGWDAEDIIRAKMATNEARVVEGDGFR